MKNYKITVTQTFYSNGENEQEALDHLYEFFDLDNEDEMEVKFEELGDF